MELVEDIIKNAGQIMTIFTICFYLVQCFFGFKLMKASCSLIGFVIGFSIGYYISGTAFSLEEYMPAVIGVIVGVALGFVAYKLAMVGLFILAGILVANIVWLIPLPESGPWLTVRYVILAAAFVAGGVLAVKLAKPCIIIITAVGGAFSAAQLIYAISPAVSGNHYLYLGVLAVLAASGLIVQFLMNRER